MYTTTLLSALLGTATLTLAASSTEDFPNSIEFRSQDSTTRTIVFRPNVPGDWKPDNLIVPGNDHAVANFAPGWQGMFYSISAPLKPEDVEHGMLGEVTFDESKTWYDVSAIDVPGDHVGVKQLFPLTEEGVKSGCEVFPCDTAYYLPDDIQTQATNDHHLVCTLGG